MSSSTRVDKQYARTTEGLRDALFDEMQDLRAGASHPQEALAFAELAGRVISSVDLDLRKEAREERDAERLVRMQKLKVRELELQAQPLLPAPSQDDEDDGESEARG